MRSYSRSSLMGEHATEQSESAPAGLMRIRPPSELAIALKQRRPIRGDQAIAERPDGTRVPFMAFPTPLYDASDALVGAVNMLIGISERQPRRAR